MRGLLCSSLVVVLASGCTTLTGSRLQRGPLQATHVLSSEQHDEFVTQVSDQGEATVRRDRQTCKVLQRSYSQARIDEFSSNTLDIPPLTLLMLGGGAGAMIYAATLPEEDELKEPLFVVGGAVELGTLIGLLLSDPTSTSTSTTTTPTDSVETEEVPDCQSTSVTLQESLSWSLTLEAQSRSGVTGADGVLSTSPVLLEMLVQVLDDEAELRRLVAGRSLRYSLALGKAPRVSGEISTRSLPEAFFDAAAQRYEQRLTGNARERWENCKLIAKSSLERFECLWQQ
jgi:hypothetical protein